MLMKPLIEFKLIPRLPGDPRHTRSHEKFIVYRFQPVEKSLWELRLALIPPGSVLHLIASCLSTYGLMPQECSVRGQTDGRMCATGRAVGWAGLSTAKASVL